MSEEDMDLSGVDANGRVDRTFRAPRFSWTPAYEATFFRSLCESVQLGLRENSSFKAEAWERAAIALQEAHGAFPTKSHLINKSDNARKRFRLWRGLRENHDFIYNSVTKTVSASDEAWASHIERESLSRALRGRPFDHEEFMEILYPDVIGSGGAPKRIMKPRRRTDGQVVEEDMPGTGVLNLQSGTGETADNRHVRPSLSETPTGSSNGSIPQQATTTLIPPRATTTSSVSALTPPDETLPSTSGRKRPIVPAFTNSAASLGGTSQQQPTGTAGKRRRTSSRGATAAPSNLPTLSASAPSAEAPSSRAQEAIPTTLEGIVLTSQPLLSELVDVLKSKAAPKWREDALDIFFRDFSEEDMDLQVKISENILTHENKAMIEAWDETFPKYVAQETTLIEDMSGDLITWPEEERRMLRSFNVNLRKTFPATILLVALPPHRLIPSIAQTTRHPHSTCIGLRAITLASVDLELHLPSTFTKIKHPANMSYANAAASGPKQTPAEAAAPQPPEIIPNESASTASLVDVDLPSVHTVSSEFRSQTIQTDTQAERIEREEEVSKAKSRARAEAEAAKEKAKKKAKRADNFLTSAFSKLSSDEAGALAIANLVAVIGVSSYLGYRAWGLYEKGRLTWQSVGLGVGILAGVGLIEGVFGGYLYRGQKKN